MESAAPSSQDVAPPLSPLLRLPVELHLEIFKQLKLNIKNTPNPVLKPSQCYSSADVVSNLMKLVETDETLTYFKFGLTNRYFHFIMPVLDMDILLNTEKRFAGLVGYACKLCRQLLPKENFASGMLKGCCGLNGKKRAARYCADCGFDPKKGGTCSPGTRVIVDKVDWVHCLQCKEVKKGNDAGSEQCRRLCKQCYNEDGCACCRTCPGVPREKVKLQAAWLSSLPSTYRSTYQPPSAPYWPAGYTRRLNLGGLPPW